MKLELVWFDSLGAKSSCILVEADKKILIDPGVAVMQPSFPAPLVKKLLWKQKAYKAIKKAASEAEYVIISHYHYDHFTDFDPILYENKNVFIKNPNEYINNSQRKRAEKFLSHACEHFAGKSLKEFLKKGKEKEYPEPILKLPKFRERLKRGFGSYQNRKIKLLKKGEKWFRRQAAKWKKYPRIEELKFGKTSFKFADGKKLNFGKTKVRFTMPLFHGIEYSRLGWVFASIIQHGEKKLMYTSDLEGPILEDNTDLICRENPDILILDGPSTYLIPFMLNLINLRRCIKNMCRIVRECDSELIIYDHHLPRDRNYKKWVKEVYMVAKKEGMCVLTAAEFNGKKPLVLEL